MKREPFAKVEAHAIGGVIAYFNLIANGTIIDVYDYTCEKRAKQACDGINLAHTKAVAERVEEFRERAATLAYTHANEVGWFCECMEEISNRIRKLPTAPEGK